MADEVPEGSGVVQVVPRERETLTDELDAPLPRGAPESLGVTGQPVASSTRPRPRPLHRPLLVREGWCLVLPGYALKLIPLADVRERLGQD